MSDMLRLFFAVELPGPVLAELERSVEGLRAAGIQGVRTVRPAGIHLTLRFLGDVAPDRVPALIDAARQAAGRIRPFNLKLAGSGQFPERGVPRVLWVGLDGDLPSLEALYRELETALEPAGFSKDRRGLSPHLTIARIRRGSPAGAGRTAAGILRSSTPSSGAIVAARSLSLIKSTLTPDGAIYDRVERIPFGDRICR